MNGPVPARDMEFIKSSSSSGGRIQLLKFDTSPYIDNTILDAVWFYSESLDVPDLKASLRELLRLYPVLAGRRAGSAVALTNKGVSFGVQSYAGSAYEFLDDEPKNGTFTQLEQAEDIASGLAPLMTVLVTNFEDGTSALGVTMAHSLMDGSSFIRLMTIWAHGHGNGFAQEASCTFDRQTICPTVARAFGSQRIRESTLGCDSCTWGLRYLFRRSSRRERSAGAKESLSQSVGKNMTQTDQTSESTPSLPGRGSYSRTGFQSNALRAKVHLSQDDLKKLKNTVKLQDGSKPTTNEALSAKIAKLLGDRFNLKPGGQLGLTANLRGRGIFRNSSNLLGNCSKNIVIDVEAAPQDMSTHDVVMKFREVGDKLRNREIATEITKDFQSQLECSEKGASFHGRHFLTNYENNLLVNNQTTYAVAQIRFGPGSCLGFVPWNVGHMIHIVVSFDHNVRPSLPTPERQLASQKSIVKKLVGATSVEAAFQACDVDGSGSLSKAEVCMFLRHTHVDLEEHELDALLNMMDTDHDGEVSYEEFKLAWEDARLSGGIDIYIKTAAEGISRADRCYIESSEFRESLLS
eukprot:TRINITY_DN64413_c0_g1_i1.p1 TRINITY_DN64413_c0_g1~~TRINITY_DN64413_c0_g1_i1.p1  ORF type:complete len:578 (-),score=59.77 TRINITY_DN64413_c0_g1_i1:54-1787(-)